MKRGKVMANEDVNVSQKYDVHGEKKRIKTSTLTMIGLMSAVLCVLSPFSIPIPFSPVPISLSLLAIYFTIYLLGMKNGTISCCIYLLIGLAGIPVFSGFSSGPGKLLGPTGGYLIGYIFLALIFGFFIDRWGDNRLLCMAGMVLGTAVCYLFGTIWLAYTAHLPSFMAALSMGVLPYLLGDFIKMIIAVLCAPIIKERLRRAGL